MLVDAAAEQHSSTVSGFPLQEVRKRLTAAIEAAAEDDAILTESWEPTLDSLTMVSVVITLEDLFDFPLKPGCLVRKGGYSSVKEGIDDMSTRVERLWNEPRKSKEPK